MKSWSGWDWSLMFPASSSPILFHFRDVSSLPWKRNKIPQTPRKWPRWLVFLVTRLPHTGKGGGTSETGAPEPKQLSAEPGNYTGGDLCFLLSDPFHWGGGLLYIFNFQRGWKEVECHRVLGPTSSASSAAWTSEGCVVGVASSMSLWNMINVWRHKNEKF